IVDFAWRKGYQYILDKPFSGFVRGAAGVQDPPYPGGQYNQALQWYNAMRGYQPTPAYPEGTPYTDPNTGTTTRFTVAGDPVTGTGWIDGQDIPPGDRRLSMVHGPFQLNLHDTVEVVLGLVGGVGADNRSSITVMKYHDVFAQYAFDNLFDLPKAPATPLVEIAELDGQAVLSWGNADRVAQTENIPLKGFDFEGYNIYQFPTSDARISDAVKIATYDLLNNVTTIVDQAVDLTTGVIVSRAVQTGANSGVQRYIKLSRNAFDGKPLVNGQDYYFGVTAYSYNGDPASPFHSLESSPVLLSVRPQSPKPGTRYLASVGDTVLATHAGASDGNVLALVIDPTKVTGHAYRVTFSSLPDGSPVWNLVDQTTNQTKLSNQTNQSGDDNYPIIDGLLVKVFGAPLDFKRMVMTSNGNGPITGKVGFTATPEPPYGGYSADWYRDVLAGGNTSLTLPTGMQVAGGWYFVTSFGDANDYATAINNWTAGNAFSRLIPNDYEIRFTAAGGKAWLAFGTKALIDVPFEIWQTGIATKDNPADDVRMIPIVLDDGDGTFKFYLDHTASGGNNDPYCDPIYWYMPQPDAAPGQAAYQAAVARMSPTYNFTTEQRHLRGMTLMNWNQRQGGNPGPAGAMPEVGTVIRIETTKPNATTDTFNLNAPTIQSSPDLAKEDLKLINVFPNPYYGLNTQERSRLDKYVTFSHLPGQATIRIYTLGAMLVKTIVKDDNTQFASWDLRNQNNLPVASGIYIVHIELPSLGETKILKLAIVQEDQFLKIY
ncbi:MAG TPA: T9SS type A sorting domain-containing protein, partial [Bacteroidota bacterium]